MEPKLHIVNSAKTLVNQLNNNHSSDNKENSPTPSDGINFKYSKESQFKPNENKVTSPTNSDNLKFFPKESFIKKPISKVIC